MLVQLLLVQLDDVRAHRVQEVRVVADDEPRSDHRWEIESRAPPRPGQLRKAMNVMLLKLFSIVIKYFLAPEGFLERFRRQVRFHLIPRCQTAA